MFLWCVVVTIWFFKVDENLRVPISGCSEYPWNTLTNMHNATIHTRAVKLFHQNQPQKTIFRVQASNNDTFTLATLPHPSPEPHPKIKTQAHISFYWMKMNKMQLVWKLLRNAMPSFWSAQQIDRFVEWGWLLQPRGLKISSVTCRDMLTSLVQTKLLAFTKALAPVIPVDNQVRSRAPSRPINGDLLIPLLPLSHLYVHLAPAEPLYEPHDTAPYLKINYL